MKHTLSVIFCASAFVLSSCSKNDEPKAFLPDLPSNDNSYVKKINYSSNYTNSYNWEFTYTNKRLTKAIGTLNNNNSYTYTAYLAYSNNGLNITRSDGKKVKVVLDNSHYISSINIENNNYKFTYSDGRLIRWEKETLDNITGQTNTRSYSNITYSNQNISQIEYTENDEYPKRKVLIKFSNGERINKNGLLPECVTKEMGLSGFEYLYYAGLLGKASQHLPLKVDYSYSEDSEKDHSISFEYSYSYNSENNVLCIFKKDANISANYTY